jgi:hypothetical protein
MCRDKPNAQHALFTHDTLPSKVARGAKDRSYVRSEKPIHNDKERWPVINDGMLSKTSLDAKAGQFLE